MIVCLWPFELAFKVVPDRAVWVRSGGYPAYPIPQRHRITRKPPGPPRRLLSFRPSAGPYPTPTRNKGDVGARIRRDRVQKGTNQGSCGRGEIGDSKRPDATLPTSRRLHVLPLLGKDACCAPPTAKAVGSRRPHSIARSARPLAIPKIDDAASRAGQHQCTVVISALLTRRHGGVPQQELIRGSASSPAL